MYAGKGWIAEPDSYHRTPPPLFESDVTTSRGWAMGQSYDRWDWDSGFTPYPGEPGADRWMAFEPNRTSSAVIVRHNDGPRPWVIAVHGFCMGFPFMDFQGLQIEPAPPRARDERGPAGAAAPWAAPGHPGQRGAVPLLRADERRARPDAGRLGHPAPYHPGSVSREPRRSASTASHWVPTPSRSWPGWTRASTPWWPASRCRTSQGCSTVTAPRHPGPVDRAQDHGRRCRERLPSGVAPELRGQGAQATAGSSSPATATGWPFPIRHSASGSTGTGHASRGTAGNHVGYLWSKQVSDFLVARWARFR